MNDSRENLMLFIISSFLFVCLKILEVLMSTKSLHEVQFQFRLLSVKTYTKMSEVKERKTYMSTDQKKYLCEFVRDNINLATGAFSNSFTHKDAENLWKKVAHVLNAMPGACKDWTAWRKIYQDAKGGVKRTLAKNAKERKKTGGGSAKIKKSNENKFLLP